MTNKILLEDYLSVSKTIKKLNIKNKTFLITGANGTIGSFFISAILKSNEVNKSNIKIIALSRNSDDTKKLFHSNSNIVYKTYCETLPHKIDYIFHFACPTKSKYFVENPLETINEIYSLTNRFISLNNERKSRLIYISSMEVYGIVKDRKAKSENQLGKLLLDSPRCSYPFAKRLSENLCHFSCLSHKSNIVIARLAQTFGAGSDINDPRLYSYLAKCVINKKDIMLATDGKSYSNYVYLSDAVNAILYIARYGKINETYNIVGKDSNYRIIDVCNMFANKKVNILYKKGKNYYPDNTKLKMSAKKIEKLGWESKYNLKKSIVRFLSYLSSEATK